MIIHDLFKPVSKQTGFTIVELLVVIVVIGILAAITIVSYTGISSRATASSLQSDLTNAMTQLKLDQVTSGSYPTDLTSANDGKGISSSSGTSYQYSYNNSVNPPTFCITATKATTSYKITNDSAPAMGGCPGHGVGGVPAITNLIANPSFETDTSLWNSVSSATVVRSADRTYSGSYSIKITPSSSTYSGIVISIPGSIGSTYTFSAYVYSLSSQSINFAADGLGVNTGLTIGTSWTRMSVTGTKINENGLFVRAIAANSSIFYVDSVMFTNGTSLYTYSDGLSPNWVWNGVVNNSTSKGPAL